MVSAVGSYEGTQIRADVMQSFFKTAKAIWYRRVVLGIIESFIAGVVVYWAWLMISNEIGSYPNWQATIVLGIPYAVPRLGIFIGFSFMMLYEVLHLYVLLKFGPALIEEELAENKTAEDQTAHAHKG